MPNISTVAVVSGKHDVIVGTSGPGGNITEYPASATTLPTTDIGTTAATLFGFGNTAGLDGSYYFEWGPAGSFDFTTTAIPVNTEPNLDVSQTITGLTPSTEYQYRCVFTNTFGPAYGATLTFTTSASVVAPEVYTLFATGITDVSAVLNGRADPNGNPAQAWFEWRILGVTGWINTAAQDIGSGTTAILYDHDLGSEAGESPLTEGVYEFRAVCNAAGIEVYGEILQFIVATGSGVAPTATTVAASGIASDGALLNATINTGGLGLGQDCTARFIWGTSPGDLSNATTTINIPANAAPVAISSVLSRLSPNTTYYFAAQVANTWGGSTGATLNFTTLAGAGSAPTVVIKPPASVAFTSFQAACDVNPNGAATDLTIYWRAVIGGTYVATTASPQAMGAGSSTLPVFHLVTGLTEATTYSYYASATNANGTSVSAEMFVTTPTAGGTGKGTQNSGSWKLWETWAIPWDPNSGVITEANPRQFTMTGGVPNQFVQDWYVDARAPYSYADPLMNGPTTVLGGLFSGGPRLWSSIPDHQGRLPLAYVVRNSRIGDQIGIGGVVDGVAFCFGGSPNEASWGGNKVWGVSIVPIDTTDPMPELLGGVEFGSTSGLANNVYFHSVAFCCLADYQKTPWQVNDFNVAGLIGDYDCESRPFPGATTWDGYGYLWGKRATGACRIDSRGFRPYEAKEHSIGYFSAPGSQYTDGSGGGTSPPLHAGCWVIDANNTSHGNPLGGDEKTPLQIVNRNLENISLGVDGRGYFGIKQISMLTDPAAQSGGINVTGHSGHVDMDVISGNCSNGLIVVNVDGPNDGPNGTFVYDDGDGIRYCTKEVTIKNVTYDMNDAISPMIRSGGIKKLNIYIDTFNITETAPGSGRPVISNNTKFDVGTFCGANPCTPCSPAFGPVLNGPSAVGDATKGVIFYRATGGGNTIANSPGWGPIPEFEKVTSYYQFVQAEHCQSNLAHSDASLNASFHKVSV